MISKETFCKTLQMILGKPRQTTNSVRLENYLFTAKGVGCCRMRGGGISHVLGGQQPQGGRCRSY